MTKSEHEPKPKRTLKPARWVFRAAVAMLFVAIGIMGVRVYRFYAAVEAVQQHGGTVRGFGPEWLDEIDWELGKSNLFFSEQIVVELSVVLQSKTTIPVNDQDLQTLIPYLKRFDKLHAIGLWEANISDEGLSYLVELDHLLELNLSRTNITNQGLQHLAHFEQLKVLILDDCKITDEGIRHLQNLKKLETLTLDGTDVTDDGLKHLKSLKNLTHLSLSNTGITDEGCADLLKAIPDLEILDD